MQVSGSVPAVNAEVFNSDYYERGVETGVSGYTNYHWRPEYVLPLANELKSRYLPNGGEALDYGCAKGFLVKALRLLGVDAQGYDISRYAIENCDPAVKQFLFHSLPVRMRDLVVSKDTLEHVPEAEIGATLRTLAKLTRQTCVIIVPLGDNNLYRIREYELDKTHQIRQDEEWWIGRFREAGFTIREFHYSFPGAKDHWLKVHPHGNGTFVLGKPS